MESATGRTAGIVGIGFSILFTAGALLLGDLVGTLGDSDEFLMEYLNQDKYLVQEMAGGVLLILSAIALVWFFACIIPPETALRDRRVPLQMAHTLSTLGAAMILTGTALLVSVPIAKAYGRLFTDVPLTGDAVALAPQVGVVVIYLPGAILLAATIAILTWSSADPTLASRGMKWFSTLISALLALSMALFVPLFLLPIWTFVAAIRYWRSDLTRISA